MKLFPANGRNSFFHLLVKTPAENRDRQSTFPNHYASLLQAYSNSTTDKYNGDPRSCGICQ